MPTGLRALHSRPSITTRQRQHSSLRDALCRGTLLAGLGLVLLAGCGPNGRKDSAEAPTPTPTVAAPGPTWTLCANEGQICAFSGTRAVRYGTTSSHVVAVFTDQVACGGTPFGEAARAEPRSCWVSNEIASAPSSEAWTECAAERQHCAFRGTRVVRYGTSTAFHDGLHAGGVTCSSHVFGDPARGVAKTCRYAATVLADGPAGDAARAFGVEPPIVLNASTAVHAGDVVGLQGDRFGTNPRVSLEGSPAAALEVVNRVGTTWLAVQIPADAGGALFVRVANETGTSVRVALNAAIPLHLDTVQLVPGGAFRIFGRALRSQGNVPSVVVDGLPATVDLDRSDDYLLTAVAPAKLAVSKAAVLTVDNGNGSGPAPLDRIVEVVAAASGDPYGLGVGWASAFGALVDRTIDTARDPRLIDRTVCDGSHDDGPAIQSAVDLVGARGGGVVRLPAGRCRIANGITLRSRVVLQGAGKASTELLYASNYPVFAQHVDLAGITDLTLANAGGSVEGPLLKDSSRLFLRNVRVRLGTSRQMYLSGNRLLVIAHCDFEQDGGIADQGPYTLYGNAGLVFEGNTTRWASGAPTFGALHDSYVHANRFSRDARAQDKGGVVHALTMDFAYRIAVVGNTFDVIDGPITNKRRNDGETLLTEGGGAARTENLGSVADATATTFSDPSNTFRLDPFGAGAIPENYGVAIVGGRGAGQTRRVLSGEGSTLTVDRPWDIVPDRSSRYATFVWGLEKSLIKDNVLKQNPRGIWLYQTALRDVHVVGNEMTEGGGIFLRAYQNLATKIFTPQYGVVIAGNRVTNASGQWMSYINAVFANADARPFGIAMLGIEMRSNAIVANRPNISSTQEDYAGTEGFVNMMRVEDFSGYESSAMPRVLGTILTGNSCTRCEVGVRIGTGAGGTTILDTRLSGSKALTADWATTSTAEKSAGTVIR